MKNFRKSMVVMAALVSQLALGAQLPASWLLSESGARSSGIREAEDLDAQGAEEVDELFDANREAVEEIALGKRNRTDADQWHLEFFTTDLGVTTSGTLGVLALKGTSGVQVYWRRRDIARRETEAAGSSDQSQADLMVSDESTPEQLMAQSSAVARSLERAGKIRDASVMTRALTRVSGDLQAMMSAMPDNPGYQWWISTLRLDISVDASGQVYPGVKAGAAARVRLNWSRLMRKKSQPSRSMAGRTVSGVNSESLRDLVATVSEELDRAASDSSMEKHDFAASSMRIGVGISASGSIGIVKAGAGVTGHLIFSRQKRPPVARAIARSNRPVLILTEGARGLEGSLIERSVFRKGIEKSLKIGRFFAKRAERANRKAKKSNWAVYQIKSTFDVSAGGDVGVAKLTGLVTSELVFKNKAF